MRATLRFKYPSQTLIFYALDGGLEKLEDIPLAERHAARVVTGHFPYGAHRYLPQPCEYVTFLREPVARVLSRYYAVEDRLGKPGHWSYDELSRTSMGLEEWVELAGESIENFQTRLIAGKGRGERLEVEDLKIAKTNLQQFLGVGLTERFDESFILIRRALGWKLPMYATRNARKTSEDAPARELSTAALELIRDRNRLDLDLYDYADELLQAAIDREGPSLQRELAAFRTLNRLPQKIAPHLPERVRDRIGSILAP